MLLSADAVDRPLRTTTVRINAITDNVILQICTRIRRYGSLVSVKTSKKPITIERANQRWTPPRRSTIESNTSTWGECFFFFFEWPPVKVFSDVHRYIIILDIILICIRRRMGHFYYGRLLFHTRVISRIGLCARYDDDWCCMPPQPQRENRTIEIIILKKHRHRRKTEIVL